MLWQLARWKTVLVGRQRTSLRPATDVLCVWTPEPVALPSTSALCLADAASHDGVLGRLEAIQRSWRHCLWDRMVRFMPRLERAGIYRLNVERTVNTEALGGGRFQSQGSDQGLFLTSDLFAFPAGLTVISYLWDSELACRPKLYFDCGNGMSEATAVELAATRRGWSRTLVTLPRGCRFMRLDLVEEAGSLTIRDITAEEVRYLPREQLTTLRRDTHFVSPYYNVYLRTLTEEARQERSYRDWLESAPHLQKELPKAGPKISVLMPVYNPEPRWLSAAIDSVLHQTYRDWQLCIADDGSDDPGIGALCERYERADPRIKLVRRPQRGHISAASNSALAVADGEFCALLDHDDLLADHALARVALEIACFPHSQVLYSDEDKILAGAELTQSGTSQLPSGSALRYDPYFKPCWNTELIQCQNYISHLGVYRTDLLRRIGGFREGFEGAQDWDLLLRASEVIRGDQIRHIPEILYHWRAARGSIALQLGEKPYAYEAGLRTIGDMLRRRNVRATVERHPEVDDGYRVRHVVPPGLRAAIVIPTRDRPELLRSCVQSVLRHRYETPFRLIIVDHDSVDPETHAIFEELQQHGAAILRVSGPFNYSAMMNRAAEFTDADIIVTLNNDTIVKSSGWLDELASQAARPEIGVVGARLLYPDDTIQHAGVILGVGGIAVHAFAGLHVSRGGPNNRARLVQEFTAVTGACMAFRRSVWKESGGFDERYLPEAFNDTDFCLRVRSLGYRVIYTPFATLYHWESQTIGSLGERSPARRAQLARESAIIRERWGKIMEHDPFYHPSLNREAATFRLGTDHRATLLKANDSPSLIRDEALGYHADLAAVTKQLD